MRDEEIITRIVALRDEVFRQIGQFERDKVTAEDNRARGAIVSLNQQIAEANDKISQLRDDQGEMDVQLQDVDLAVQQLQTDVVALAERMTLCEGRLTRLEAKP